jgi:PAS domain S-box-containing protein
MISTAERRTRPGPRVVVVNDDPVQLRTLRALLEDAGYRVVTFESPAMALQAFRSPERVDLFVVDLHMPGIDGWKVCRLLRSPEYRHHNGVPILVVSAIFTGAEVESITSELGSSAFLEVPFRPEELLDFARALLEGRKPRVVSTALVLEDDDAVRATTARAFRDRGYRVVEAQTLAEAQAAVRDERLKVAVVDYHLPDGTCEPLLDLARDGIDGRVTLVMTGDGDPDLPLRLLERGVDGYVRKPFDPAFLVELAERASRQRALLRVEAALKSRTRELTESEHRYRVLVDTIPDSLLVLDRQNRIRTANPAAAQRLGSDVSHLTDRSVAELTAAGCAVELEAGVAALRRGGGYGFVTTLRTAAGEDFPVEVTGRPLKNHSQDELLLVARDITERRRVEEERRTLEKRAQAGQRLESLGVLAGGVAHDFNNLLVGILGNAALARMDLPPDSPGIEFLEQIEVAARSAAELTEQIMTFAGKRTVKNEDVDVAELLRELEPMLRPVVSRKARVSYRVPRLLPRIEGDAGQLRQVAMNLIINASDALEGEPGHIEVEARSMRIDDGGPEDLVGGHRLEPGRYVAVRVSDDGCGMDAVTVQRIFEPFFSTKVSGRGLGLAAALGIARSHGGGVAVRSEPGTGTVMTVFFPGGVSAVEEEAGRERSPEWVEGGRILVVDDEPSVRRLAATTLTRNGFQVVEAVDGREGLEQVRELGRSLALVLLDVTMPEIDGLEVLETIRASHPDLPVLLSSGFSAEIITEPSRNEATGFLPKPYGPDELLEAASRLLHRNGEDGIRAAVGGNGSDASGNGSGAASNGSGGRGNGSVASVDGSGRAARGAGPSGNGSAASAHGSRESSNGSGARRHGSGGVAAGSRRS